MHDLTCRAASTCHLPRKQERLLAVSYHHRRHWGQGWAPLRLKTLSISEGSWCLPGLYRFSWRETGAPSGHEQASEGQLALFAPTVKTDAGGKATVDLKLPDNLTRYRVMAVSVDAARGPADRR